MFNRIIYIVVVFFWHTVSVCAQDLAVQFRNFSEKMKQAESVYFKSNIVMDYADEKPVRQEIVYERTPENIYYKTANMEMIANREISLMIYRESKKVLWQKSGQDKEKQDATAAMLLPSDTLLKKVDSVVYKGIIDAAHTYIIYSSKKYIRETQFSFGVSDGLLKQAVYQYNSNLKLGVEKTTLTFTDFAVNGAAKINTVTNSVLKYENKTYHLMPAYAGYQLICLDSKY